MLHYECYHCQTKRFSSCLLIRFKFHYRQNVVLKQKFRPQICLKLRLFH